MNTANKIFSCLIIIGASIGFILIAIVYNNDMNMIEQITNDLNRDGFSVVTGYTDSPAVIQTTNSYLEFVQIAKASNISTVYQLSNSPPKFFFVTNSTYGCEFTP
jgi:hypothetical protein